MPARSLSGATLTRRAVAGLAVLVAVVVLALAGCGSSSAGSGSGASGGAGATSSTSTTHFAKTKFVLHVGLAFGAFHRYIYKPAKAGDFSHPFSHKLTLVKAGLAALFIRHELKLALGDAQSSPTLRKLVSPITALDARLHSLGGQLKSGDASGVSADNGQVSSIEQSSAGAGSPIAEQAPAHL